MCFERIRCDKLHRRRSSSRMYHGIILPPESPKFERFGIFFGGGRGDEKPDNTNERGRRDKEEREYLGGRTSLLLFGNRLRVSRFLLLLASRIPPLRPRLSLHDGPSSRAARGKATVGRESVPPRGHRRVKRKVVD